LRKGNTDSLRTLDYMSIGQDIAVGIDNYARSDCPLMSYIRDVVSNTLLVRRSVSIDHDLHHCRGNPVRERDQRRVELAESFWSASCDGGAFAWPGDDPIIPVLLAEGNRRSPKATDRDGCQQKKSGLQRMSRNVCVSTRINFHYTSLTCNFPTMPECLDGAALLLDVIERTGHLSLRKARAFMGWVMPEHTSV
jgi:hypothetical protein